LDPSQFQQALQDKFQQIIKDKVKEGYYVRNPNLIRKVWNNFPITSSTIEWWYDLKGGQCGEFADWGRQWVKDWAQQTYGPGVVVDSIWVGERSSRYPDGLLDSADALIQANHVANRVILPNGESLVIDFWDGVTQYRDKGDAALANIKPIPEHEWTQKWRDKMTWHDVVPEPFDKYLEPAELSNVNKYQNSLRQQINAYEARHPSAVGGMSPDQIQENNQLIDQAIANWQKENTNIPPEVQRTIINNWRKNGTAWEMYRPDPPMDPASSVIEAGFDILDQISN
jgi:hypothetical protein